MQLSAAIARTSLPGDLLFSFTVKLWWFSSLAQCRPLMLWPDFNNSRFGNKGFDYIGNLLLSHWMFIDLNVR